MLCLRRPWNISGLSPLFLISLFVICLAVWPCTGKGGGGGGGGGGRGGGGGGSSSGRSSWGSSSRSGGGSSGSSSSRTGWGSSASSGSSRGFGARPSYSAPSHTMARISAPSSSWSSGTAKASYPRAQANIPTASISSPTRVVYTPAYSSYTPNHNGFSGTHMAASVIGGYYLGRMMSHPVGYGGYPYYGYYHGGNPYDGYVPYRERYHEYLTTTTPGPTTTYTNYEQTLQDLLQKSNCMMTKSFDECYLHTTTSTIAPRKAKEIDLCTLARWNRELPYAEVPNMALSFLSNDAVSGNTTEEKAKFVYQFFKELPRAYASYNSSADVFAIPSTKDLKDCNMLSTEGVDVSQSATQSVEEPILTAARNIIGLYSNASKATDNLRDVVTAAKACLPTLDKPGEPKVIPCLDFSLIPQQLESLKETKSVFGNGEICRSQLNRDMLSCAPSGEEAKCRLDHLVALNLFARNYYLCTSELEEDAATKIRSRMESEKAAFEEWQAWERENSSSGIQSSVSLLMAAVTALLSVVMNSRK